MKSDFEEDSAKRMNFYTHMQNRRRRKLPYVQRRPSGYMHSFWPTFRGALAWMRKNQETFNTAIGLIDIYPNLIQDTCMDIFWDFIKPFVVDVETGRTRKLSGPTTAVERGKSKKNASFAKVVPPVPTISVTNNVEEDADDVIKDSDFNKRKTKVYVSGQSESEYLSSPFSQLMTELRHEYTVSSTVPGNCSSTTKMCDVLASCDAFVFLMSQESVTNPSIYRDLSAAWTMDIPTMCVKPPGFRLPSPLPESVLMHSLDSRTRSTNRKQWGESLFPHSVTPSGDRNAKRGSHARAYSPLPQIRSSSARELRSEMKHPFIHRDSCDLVMVLIQGYREAVVWDPIKQEQSFGAIKLRIEGMVTKLFCSSATPTSPALSDASRTMFLDSGNVSQTKAGFLDVPSFAMYTPLNQSLGDLHSPVEDDDDLSLHLPTLSKSPMVHSVSDPENLKTNSMEKETFYVVFKDRHSPGNVVKWPPDVNDDDIDDIFSDSPLSFRDVDLTLEMRPESDLDSSTSGY